MMTTAVDMAYSVETTTRTPITQLRESLDKADRLVVQVDGSSIEEFLTLLDSIDQQFEVLESDDTDLRSERSRWESLLSRINSQPGPIVRAATVAGVLEKLRAAHPPAESFWWHLDSEVTRRRVRSIRQLIITLVTIVVLVVGGYWAINFFFPPNPEAVLMVETNSSLDRLITEQRWQEALELVRNARTQLPDNPELMLWEVVLNERLGDNAAAAAAMAEAEQSLSGQRVQLLLYLGNNRLRVGDIEGALAAGEEALQLDPNEAQVYFLLGGVAEAQGDIPLAISYFEQTFQLAEGSNPQLAVIARVRMGNLLQNPGSVISPQASPTAAP
jgi:tetratricopeptide (TPR) repeat protein